MRASRRDRVQDYADKFGVDFFAGQKPWGREVDVVMPCATQNEVNLEDAKKIVAAGVKYYIEVSNMPTTNDALAFLIREARATATLVHLIYDTAFKQFNFGLASAQAVVLFAMVFTLALVQFKFLGQEVEY